MTTQEHGTVSYTTYWRAWLCLLVITVTMVFIGSAPVLIGGMMLKATIIALWFMHLRYERLDFVLCVIISIFCTALLLYLLILSDGRAM